MKKIIIISCCLWTHFFFPSLLKAEILTVGNVNVLPGESVTLSITVDQPADIVGAVFTLNYNSQYLTLLDVQSSFFDTFAHQWSAIVPLPNPMPVTNVFVGDTNYLQPLLSSKINSGTKIVAARVQPGATSTTLFQVQFKISATIPGEIYPVSITQSSVNNGAAGYNSAGESVPLLLGQKTGAAISINPTVVNGNIFINQVNADSDGDGINDAWELQYFGNLTTANATSDFDKDGYTDLQEFLSQQNNEMDPNGNIYDPKQHNAPGGTGYKKSSTGFWILMMPVLMNGH